MVVQKRNARRSFQGSVAASKERHPPHSNRTRCEELKMNLVKLLRFFFTGPGAVVVVVAVILGVGEVIHEGQERQKAEAEKRQVQRPLGQVKPSETVDKSTAPKEVVLSNKRIVPGAHPANQRPPKLQLFPLQMGRANVRFPNW